MTTWPDWLVTILVHLMKYSCFISACLFVSPLPLLGLPQGQFLVYQDKMIKISCKGIDISIQLQFLLNLGLLTGSSVLEICSSCHKLRKLSLAYIGASSFNTILCQALPKCHNLLDLRWVPLFSLALLACHTVVVFISGIAIIIVGKFHPWLPASWVMDLAIPLGWLTTIHSPQWYSSVIKSLAINCRKKFTRHWLCLWLRFILSKKGLLKWRY